MKDLFKDISKGDISKLSAKMVNAGGKPINQKLHLKALCHGRCLIDVFYTLKSNAQFWRKFLEFQAVLGNAEQERQPAEKWVPKNQKRQLESK